MIDPRIWTAIIPLALPAAIMVVTPPGWRLRAAIGWIVLPAIGYIVVIGWELATRPVPDNALANAVFGFLLVGSLLAIPWIALSFVGFGIGLLIRKMLGIGRPAPAESAPEPAALAIAELEREVDRLAARIEAPGSALPTFGATRDNARPHVESDGRYHWVVVERGEELERRSSASLDELLYWVFASITWDMASEFATRNRDESEDFRRRLFAHQIELLGRLEPGWVVRRQAELDRTLAENPFVDQGHRA